MSDKAAKSKLKWGIAQDLESDRIRIWFYLHKEFRGAAIRILSTQTFDGGRPCRDPILSTQRICARPGSDFIYTNLYIKKFSRCAGLKVKKSYKKRAAIFKIMWGRSWRKSRCALGASMISYDLKENCYLQKIKNWYQMVLFFSLGRS